MTGVPPFGETAENLLSSATDDFDWLVLADHLDEIGRGELAQLVRDGNWWAFRAIHEFLEGSSYDPASMKLVVQVRRGGEKFRNDPRWLRYRTFYTRRGFPGIRVAFYRENPTPHFFDPFDSTPHGPKLRVSEQRAYANGRRADQ